MNKARKVWGGMKKLYKCKLSGLSAKRKLCEGRIVSTALSSCLNLEYGGKRKDEIECRGDETSEKYEYMRNNTNGSLEK